jgi:hypothetical protein
MSLTMMITRLGHFAREQHEKSKVLIEPLMLVLRRDRLRFTSV